MPWSYTCASCGSKDVQPTVHELFCLECGRLTDKHGNAVPLDEQNLSADEYINLQLGGK